MMSAIPTIDISPFIDDSNSSAAASVVSAVRDACVTRGFFQIVGHNVPRALQKEALDAAKTFFALPEDEKRKLDRAVVPRACGRGYECLKSQEQTEGKVGDSKEGYYISCDVPIAHRVTKDHPKLQGPNIWPSSDIIPASTFQAPLELYHRAMLDLTHTMLTIFAAGIPAMNDEHIKAFTADYPLALLSPKHYPPVPKESSSDIIGCGEHTDFGALTLLLQDKTSGLEIKDGDGWVAVPPNEDVYVVNIGDMMQKWTRGLYKSTLHRVTAPHDVHRYSIPFFFDGNPAVRLVPFDGPVEGEVYQTVEEHMIERLRRTALMV